MISEQRDNCNFILSSNPEDFDLEGAQQALLVLFECYFDMTFQVDLGPEGFQGPDYHSWKTKILYKLSRVKSSIKKFQYRVKDLQENSELNLLKMAVRAFLNNTESPSRRKVLEDLVK